MERLRKGNSDEPIAQKTIFGWVLSGPISSIEEFSVPALEHHCSIDQELQDLLTRFWSQEEVQSSTNSSKNPKEEECERHFLSTHTRDSSGRYIVRLPFKSSPSTLGESRLTALRCLLRLKGQLSSDAIFKQRYEDFIQEYQTLGHMKASSTPVDSTLICYLPHHGVLREQSSTTKLRVVLNGSSSTSNGTSLNEILHAGSKLQTEISDVLLWIRSHRFLFSTDIVKMFRQIAVHPDD